MMTGGTPLSGNPHIIGRLKHGMIKREMMELTREMVDSSGENEDLTMEMVDSSMELEDFSVWEWNC